jgi:hypothetical protein
VCSKATYAEASTYFLSYCMHLQHSLSTLGHGLLDHWCPGHVATLRNDVGPDAGAIFYIAVVALVVDAAIRVCSRRQSATPQAHTRTDETATHETQDI